MICRRNIVALALGPLARISCEASGPTEPAQTLEPTPLGPAAALAPNTWITKAGLPSGRHGVTLGVAKNSAGRDIVYAFGGYDTFNVSTTVSAYDFTTNTWTSKAPLPIALARSNGVGKVGGRLFISGGLREIPHDNIENLPYLFVYDPAEDSWTRKADLPMPSHGGVTGVIGGRLYVATYGKLFRYNPNTDRWATLAPSKYEHFEGGGGAINGKLYLAGGYSFSGGGDEVEAYDPVTNTWSPRAPMPTARMWMQATVVNNKLYVIGGRELPAETSELATVEVFTLATNKWTTRRPMPTAREQLGVTTFVTPSGNPRILAVGGWEHLTTNEMYAP